ncbi:MFS general substrate transporter [Colletotrichum zoysiae]|uniref:MFS general substrate transporter n=1 Tax=Colletotrichum zoysiae TaxID=1216348 RepID=A0AAD9HAZ8_9PEZI|nr:MFS general substrate transporter [Colletotrichum zoysiae]
MPKKNCTTSNGGEVAATRSEDKNIDTRYFDGTATLTAGDRVILIPNPSGNPRDPLNLPKWHKQLVVGTMVLYTVSGLCLISALFALIVYVMPDYGREGITEDQTSDLYTVPSLFLGIGNLVSLPIAVAVGRRPVMLVFTVLLFMYAILCSTNRNYYWHLGGRMLAAFAAAQCQALSLLIMQDIYFLHQRARIFQIFASAEVTVNSSLTVVSPYMADALGWRSWYWMLAGFSGVAMILMALFIPETAFDRPIEAFMGTSPNGLATKISILRPIDGSQSPDPKHTTNVGEAVGSRERCGKRTSISNFQIFVCNPKWNRCWPFLKQIGQLCLFPHVLWVAAETLVKSPYNWRNTSVSLIQLGQIPIALMGVPLVGWLSDYVIGCAARRNQGVHEPEKRLIAWVIPTVTALLLTILYEYVLRNPEIHPSFAGAILVILPATRGLVGFGLSTHIIQYLASIGSVTTFGIYAAVTAVFCLLGIILYFAGKRVRRACARLTQ